MKKEVVIGFFVLLSFIYIMNIRILVSPESTSLTGAAGLTSASVSLTIIAPEEIITIDSPLNQTYNFGVGEDYTLDLNVSANFAASSWTYALWDLKHNVKVLDNVGFSPNTTFDAVRWSNLLIVEALNSSGDIVNASVNFFINVTNSAPFFGQINSSIEICEDNSLSYFFNVTDVDEQVLQLSLTPVGPFYLSPLFTSETVQTSNIELFSGIINDTEAINGTNGWKVYTEIIEVTDQQFSDTAYTNITAIRINDAPVMSLIGVQTVWTLGDNSTFYKQVQVNDEEDGNQNSSNIKFNISFSGTKLFNITNEGIMNFTPNSSQIGVYNITVCANDTGISNVYPGISSLCGQDGSSRTTCQNFSLTVTNQNRRPTIINYYPSNLTLTASGGENLFFNITEYDPDGTIPDAYWYVDGVLQEYDSGSLVDNFTYSFGCGVSGAKIIKAEITDGVLNDSIQWSVNVGLLQCPRPSEKGGGGDGAHVIACNEKWVCSIWGICQNTERSLGSGLLSGEDYRTIKDECFLSGFDEMSCGVQTRTCFDINSCNTSYQLPEEFQSCHYTESPNCNDKIKNCHSGACELLVDCGGPCAPCPSCSDGIKNQNEEGVDCGGPCPWKCEVEKPLLKRLSFRYTLLILSLLIILILVIIKVIIKIFKDKQKLDEN